MEGERQGERDRERREGRREKERGHTQQEKLSRTHMITFDDEEIKAPGRSNNH